MSDSRWLDELSKAYVAESVGQPANLNEELLQEQKWPNDFITKNGSAMCVTFDRDKNEIGFELMYEDDGYKPDDAIGFQCTRGNLEVGFIDYNDPRYKK